MQPQTCLGDDHKGLNLRPNALLEDCIMLARSHPEMPDMQFNLTTKGHVGVLASAARVLLRET